MFARGKALFGVLSAVAVILPAAALAFLGVRANQAERERARVSFEAANQNEARFLAAALDDEATRALDALAPLVGPGGGDADALRLEVGRWPTVEHVFFLGAAGEVAWPAPEGRRGAIRAAGRGSEAAGEADDAGEGGAGARGYLRRMRAERRDAELLAEARRAEARADGEARARRAYLALAGGSGDAAAQALLGLGRLELRAGRKPEAAAHFARLGERFAGEVDEEGVSYAILSRLGGLRAAPDAAEALALHRALLEEAHPAPPAARAAFLVETRALAAEGPELAALDARARELAFAAALAAGGAELAAAAAGEPQARRAPGPPGRWLVFRRHAGGVLGVVVTLPGLQAAAEAALGREVAAANLPGASEVRVSGEPLGEDAQSAARGFLALERPKLLAAVQVSLWGDAGAADRAGRASLLRYLALVGGLVLVMLIGVVATYRGAARERELGKLKSDFVSTVSHELKTPLTSIRMFAEMLREGVAGGDTERQHRYHDVIVRESERLGRLIANVLDFSQIERGARRYDKKPTSAVALAEEAVETFRRLADGEGHPIEVAVAAGAAGPGAATVAADREALVQSLLNLLSNAAKYGGKGNPVVVGVDAAAGEVRLWVRDRGPGIAAADQKRIFREFWRAPEALRSGVEGTGLGLALVRRHVEAHGGRIEIESAPGQGATFTLVLPRAEAEDVAAPAAQRAASEGQS